MSELKSACFLACVLLLLSCGKNEDFGPQYADPQDTIVIGANRLLVGCEGNFMVGNASITMIDLESGAVQQQAFKNANGHGVGDVLQSMHRRNDTLWAVVNNSGLIRVMNDSSLVEWTTIEGLVSPRHAFAWRDELWVSDLYGNQVSAFDVSSGELLRQLPVEGWTEHLLVWKNELWVSNLDSNRIHRFNRVNEVGKWDLEFTPQFMFVAGDDGLCIAGMDSSGTAHAMALQADGDTVRREFANTRLSTASASDESIAMVLGGEALIMNADLQVAHHFSVEVQTPYGLCLDSKRGHLYVADAKDYASQGVVYQYDIRAGSLINTFETGYIPQALMLAL